MSAPIPQFGAMKKGLFEQNMITNQTVLGESTDKRVRRSVSAFGTHLPLSLSHPLPTTSFHGHPFPFPEGSRARASSVRASPSTALGSPLARVLLVQQVQLVQLVQLVLLVAPAPVASCRVYLCA